jgi:hypothetical protein
MLSVSNFSNFDSNYKNSTLLNKEKYVYIAVMMNQLLSDIFKPINLLDKTRTTKNKKFFDLIKLFLI